MMMAATPSVITSSSLAAAAWSYYFGVAHEAQAVIAQVRAMTGTMMTSISSVAVMTSWPCWGSTSPAGVEHDGLLQPARGRGRSQRTAAGQASLRVPGFLVGLTLGGR